MPALIAQTQLSDAEFELLRRFVYDKAGIALTDQKKTLLANRLRKRLRALELDSFKQYYDFLVKGDKRSEEMEHFLNAVTTNETYFFRNDKLWDFVGGDLLDWLVEKNGKSASPTMRFWSAASSSGEEAYTLAITLHQKLRDFSRWNLSIIGSDISERMLARARAAVYEEYAVQHLDAAGRRKYFEHDKAANTFQLRPTYRNMVQFRNHNLRDPFAGFKFDVVFLRNVMMYFDHEMKCRVIDTITAALAPGGYLIIGDVDPMREGSGLREHCMLDYVRPSVYRKPPGPRSAAATKSTKG